MWWMKCVLLSVAPGIRDVGQWSSSTVYECVWDERIYNIFPQQEQQNIEKNFPEGTKPGPRQRTTYHPSDYKLITSGSSRKST
jgi:hypothetical protein